MQNDFWAIVIEEFGTEEQWTFTTCDYEVGRRVKEQVQANKGVVWFVMLKEQPKEVMTKAKDENDIGRTKLAKKKGRENIQIEWTHLKCDKNEDTGSK